MLEGMNKKEWNKSNGSEEKIKKIIKERKLISQS